MARRKRIGLYCQSDVIGGAEASLLNVAACHTGDAELVIATPSIEVIEAAARVAPAVERKLIAAGHARAEGRGLHGVVALRRDLARLDLDLLQITLPNPFAARDVQLAALSLRLPVVTVQQLVLPAQRRRGALLVRLFALATKATVAVGHQSGREIASLFGIPKRKIQVIHNGVPAAVPEAIELDGRPVIGCVARYEEQKALHRLIAVMPELPEARLLLIGDGSLRQDLEAQAVNLGIEDRVQIEGWTSEARASIAGFDVFVLPSVDEAFPLTIVEAMLARTPVVATNVGSVSEAVSDGETGLLVESGDADGLTSAIRRVLDDQNLADDLTRRAYDLACRSFTAETMAERYAELWRSILTPRA